MEEKLYRDRPSNVCRHRVHRRIAIIGAGPFGLALAAKLQAANADFILFGRVMSFWRDHVPLGTRLMSGPLSCSLSYDGFSCTTYGNSRGTPLSNFLTAEEFVAYGFWFQREACPSPDERTVVNVTHESGTYTIHVDDGDQIVVEHLVVAIGLKAFAFRPPEFAALSSEFVSHASDLRDLRRFQGKTVAIIGSGQSALECSALLAEKNADVEVITRSKCLLWRYAGHLGESSARTTRNLRMAIRGALNNPDIYRRLPGFVRAFWLRRTLRPAGFSEVKPRLSSVRFVFGRKIAAASVRGNHVELALDDHSTRSVDHVVLGTGYRINVNAIPFLAPELRLRIVQNDGYPELNSSMESTVPGLYFTGAAAAWSFGPTMWFVLRAPWAADRIDRALLGNVVTRSEKTGSFVNLLRTMAARMLRATRY